MSKNILQPIKTLIRQISHVKNILSSEIRILFQPNTTHQSLCSYNNIRIRSHQSGEKQTIEIATKIASVKSFGNFPNVIHIHKLHLDYCVIPGETGLDVKAVNTVLAWFLTGLTRL